MDIVTGGITTGENFFEGRKEYIQQLSTKLAHNDVLIVGPRRTGKTSLIKEFLATAESLEKKYLYLSLEDVRGLYQFYIRIIREVLYVTNRWGLLATETAEFVRNSCNKISSIFSGKVKINPESLGTEVENTIEIKIPTFDPKTVKELQEQLSSVLAAIKQPLVIVLDEFPEVILKFDEKSRRDDTAHLMAGLRAVRQKLRFDEIKIHQVIVAGSVNLQNTLSFLGLNDTINDLEQLKVLNLSPDQSVKLLMKLGEGSGFHYNISAGVDSFVKRQFAYCTPFYIQLFADNLRTIKQYKSLSEFSSEHLRDAYKTLITGDRGPNYFLKRLENPDYYSKSERDHALRIFGKIAASQYAEDISTDDSNLAQIVTDNIERMKLISKLVSDDFLQIGDGGKYRFDCQLICNYWHYAVNGGPYLK
jgi:hypothetical protein